MIDGGVWRFLKVFSKVLKNFLDFDKFQNRKDGRTLNDILIRNCNKRSLRTDAACRKFPKKQDLFVQVGGGGWKVLKVYVHQRRRLSQSVYISIYNKWGFIRLWQKSFLREQRYIDFLNKNNTEKNQYFCNNSRRARPPPIIV